MKKNKPIIDRTGEENTNNQGLKMLIKEYRSSTDIDVEFEDGCIVNTTYSYFAKKKVKNNNYPTVFGVGYVGSGQYKSTIKGERQKQYQYWNNMIARCYSEIYKEKYPTYINCSVYKEWLNLQNFGKWFDENYYEINNELMCLDKDILHKGNKIYSPDTCVFVPERINLLFTKNNNSRGELPIGVYYDNTKKKYMAQCNYKTVKNTTTLGRYDTPLQAFEKYKQEKEKHIKEVAEQYKDKIPLKLYNAMINYIVEITD